MNVYILKIPVYLQILFDVNLNFIEQFDFLEEFDDFGGINLSEKCVNVSCYIVLVSNVSKVRAFYKRHIKVSCLNEDGSQKKETVNPIIKGPEEGEFNFRGERGKTTTDTRKTPPT